MKINLCDGKYTYVFEEDTGNQYCLRHGKEWRDLTGDNLTLALAQEIYNLKNRLSEYEDREKLQDLAEELACDEHSKDYCGVHHYTEDEGSGFTVVRYDNSWDYSAGESRYYYSNEDLRKHLNEI